MFSFILNPHAGRGRAGKVRPQIERYMEGAGVEYRVVETSTPSDAIDASRNEAMHADVVVSTGGDGSLHYVAAGLIEARLSGAKAVLAVLPAGTGNDFARMTGIPADLDQALSTILKAGTVVADHGWVIWDQDGVAVRRPFVNCAGAGLDAQSAFLAGRIKRVFGNASYLVAPMLTVPGWRAPASRIVLEASPERPDEEWSGDLTLASVTNGVWIGGGIPISPDAKIDDRMLDLCLVDKVSMARAYWLLAQAARGKHTGSSRVIMRSVTRVRISTAKPVPVYVDGEPGTRSTTEVIMEVAAGELPVVSAHAAKPSGDET